MKSVTHKNLSCKYSKGLSLIEILVTVVVLSIGLLGIAGMQAQGVRYSHDSYARSQATMLANELIERMHANPDGVSNGDYVSALSVATLNCSAAANDPSQSASTKDCAGTGDVCTVTELAQIDYFRTRCGNYLGAPTNAYVGGVEHLLPNGSISITCTDDATITDANPCTNDNSRSVTIIWQDPNDKGFASSTLQVQVNARLL